MNSTILTTRRGLLAGLGALAWWPGLAAAKPARLPLVLGQKAPPDLDPAGWLVSEKLDGVRGYWDGQQLRFRSGLPVAAPAWFTAGLPPVALDGELWMGRGRFEPLVAAVRRQQPQDEAWRQIRLQVFELPEAAGPFAERAASLQRLAASQPSRSWAALPQRPVADRRALMDRLNTVVAEGGEGLMLHRAEAPFVAGRTPELLKLKPQDDAEAQVIGHIEGQGRLAGTVGALRVRTPDGLVFKLGSGLSDAQRADPPPIGSWVTYTHQGHTAAGVPRFARYLRQREV